jgi:hypothetical protein
VVFMTTIDFRGFPRQKSGKDRSGDCAFCKLYA